VTTEFNDPSKRAVPAGAHHRSDRPYGSVLEVEPTPHAPLDAESSERIVASEGRPRAPRISREDVFAAADALLVEGHRPTIDRVRMRLGRGSPNTINDFLDGWWQKLGSRLRDLPGHEFPQLPERVAKALQLLWTEALDGAQETLRAAIHSQQQGLAQFESELRVREAQLAEAHRVASARDAALEENLTLARTQLNEANSRAASLEESLREREQTLARLRMRVDTLEAELLGMRARLESEQAARVTERTKLDERYEATEARWLAEVDRARERAKAAEKQIVTQAAELARVHRDSEFSRSALVAARHELQAALAMNGQLKQHLGVLERAAKKQIGTVRAPKSRSNRRRRTTRSERTT
jgi:hypothetical protein